MAVLQSINETFTESEMIWLKRAKGTLTWREFILNSAELMILKNNQKEDAKLEQ